MILFQGLQMPPRQTDHWSETVDINSHNVKFQLTFMSLTFSYYIRHAYPHRPPQRCWNKPKERKVMAKLTSRFLDVACCGYFPASMLTFPCPGHRGGKMWGGGGEHGEYLGLLHTAPQDRVRVWILMWAEAKKDKKAKEVAQDLISMLVLSFLPSGEY